MLFENINVTDGACTVHEDFESAFNDDGCPRREFIEVQGGKASAAASLRNEIWHLNHPSTEPALRHNCSFPGEQKIQEKDPL